MRFQKKNDNNNKKKQVYLLTAFINGFQYAQIDSHMKS